MEYSEWMEQLEALRLRGTTLLRALRLFYAALAGRWFVTRSWAALTDVVVKEFTVRGVQGTPGVTGNTYMFARFGLRTFNSLSSGPMNPPFAQNFLKIRSITRSSTGVFGSGRKHHQSEICPWSAATTSATVG